jgi:hypothetical protein
MVTTRTFFDLVTNIWSSVTVGNSAIERWHAKIRWLQQHLSTPRDDNLTRKFETRRVPDLKSAGIIDGQMGRA